MRYFKMLRDGYILYVEVIKCIIQMQTDQYMKVPLMEMCGLQMFMDGRLRDEFF